MHLSHPQTILPLSVEKLSFTESIPGTKTVGDRWYTGELIMATKGTKWDIGIAHYYV